MDSCAKKRKYLDDYIKYGFTVISNAISDTPQRIKKLVKRNSYILHIDRVV